MAHVSSSFGTAWQWNWFVRIPAIQGRTCICENSRVTAGWGLLGLESQILRLGLLVPSGFLPCCRLQLSQISVTWCSSVRKFDVADWVEWGSKFCQDQWRGTWLLPALGVNIPAFPFCHSATGCCVGVFLFRLPKCAWLDELDPSSGCHVSLR